MSKAPRLIRSGGLITRWLSEQPSFVDIYPYIGIFEVVEDFDTNTYRAVYTVRFGRAIYVLHCFQKKSTKGVETAHYDIDLIKKRLRAAQDHAKGSEHD
jgi:phage-related protein